MLLEKTTKFTEDMKELRKSVMTMIIGDGNVFTNDNELKLLTTCIRLMDQSTEIMIEQAKTIEDINKKLDELLKMKK